MSFLVHGSKGTSDTKYRAAVDWIRESGEWSPLREALCLTAWSLLSDLDGSIVNHLQLLTSWFGYCTTSVHMILAYRKDNVKSAAEETLHKHIVVSGQAVR